MRDLLNNLWWATDGQARVSLFSDKPCTKTLTADNGLIDPAGTRTRNYDPGCARQPAPSSTALPPATVRLIHDVAEE